MKIKEIEENQRESKKTGEHRQKSKKQMKNIYANRRTSMKIDENQ